MISRSYFLLSPYFGDFLASIIGGVEALLSATRMGATTDFEDVGHLATEMMEKYYVGEVDANTLPAAAKNNPTSPIQATTISSNQSSRVLLKFLQYLVPLLILGFAFALQSLEKEANPMNHKY